MASRSDGRELPLDIAADICDYVAAGETPEAQADRRLEMAAKYKTVSWETIIALTAHVKFRMRDAQQAVAASTRERIGVLVNAGDGMDIVEESGIDTTPFRKKLHRAELVDERSFEARARLREGKLSEAIELFGKAGDVDALRAIADVYENKRPDIAAKALLAAGLQLEVLALINVLQDGNKKMAARIVSLLGERS